MFFSDFLFFSFKHVQHIISIHEIYFESIEVYEQLVLSCEPYVNFLTKTKYIANPNIDIFLLLL